MPVKAKTYLSAIAFSLYIHGLTFYFTLAGFAKVQTTALTALYQILTLSIFGIVALFNADRKLFKVELIDVLYFFFMILFVLEYLFAPGRIYFPKSLAIYFSVYWGALVLARSLNFEQFKLTCYATTGITTVTSLINYGLVGSGSGNWVGNGSRLAAGASGNPIILGYTGAFAYLACFVLFIKVRSLVGKLVWLILSTIGFMVCSFTGTRSATLSCLGGTILIVIYSLNVIGKTNRALSRFALNTVSIAGIVLCGILFFSTVISPTSANSLTASENSSPIVTALGQGVERISSISQLGNDEERDVSAQGRVDLYNAAWKAFQNNPIVGAGLYSIESAHNAFLQTAAEFGLFGVVTFVAPFVYLSIQLFRIVLRSLRSISSSSAHSPERFLNSDYFMIACFAIIFWIQAVCSFSFHGDPYRNYLPLGSIGILIAFLRLKQKSTI